MKIYSPRLNTLRYEHIHRVYDHALNCVVCGDEVEPGFIACEYHNASWKDHVLNGPPSDDIYVAWYKSVAVQKRQVDAWIASRYPVGHDRQSPNR